MQQLLEQLAQEELDKQYVEGEAVPAHGVESIARLIAERAAQIMPVPAQEAVLMTEIGRDFKLVHGGRDMGMFRVIRSEISTSDRRTYTQAEMMLKLEAVQVSS